MDRSAFAELLAKFRRWPRMWVADERFTTFVAFVDGADAAAGGELLVGFPDWLVEQYELGESSFAWCGLIVDHVLPHHPESRTSMGDLDEEASRPLNAELFDRLLSFLSRA